MDENWDKGHWVLLLVATSVVFTEQGTKFAPAMRCEAAILRSNGELKHLAKVRGQ